MRNFKLIIVFLLIVATVLACCACSQVDNSITSEDGKWKYIENNDGTITISSVVEMEESLTIPSTVDGKVVSAISEKFFVIINDGSSSKKLKDTYANNEVLKEVIFEANIKEIPNMAFYLCSSLVSVQLPSSLEKIGDFTFYGCESLKEITLPENCKSIGGYAFRECSSLETVTIKSSEIINIGDKCFYMIDEKERDDDQYYIISGLNIVVGNVDYSFATLETLRKQTRNNSYKYWQEYVKANVVVSDYSANN